MESLLTVGTLPRRQRTKIRELVSADLIYRFPVFFVDHAALDLERGRHFAFVDGEFARQKVDAFDALVVTELTGQAGGVTLDAFDELRIFAKLFAGSISGYT